MELKPNSPLHAGIHLALACTDPAHTVTAESLSVATWEFCFTITLMGVGGGADRDRETESTTVSVKVRGQLAKSVLAFRYVGSGYQTQMVKFGSKCPSAEPSC